MRRMLAGVVLFLAVSAVALAPPAGAAGSPDVHVAGQAPIGVVAGATGLWLAGIGVVVVLRRRNG